MKDVKIQSIIYRLRARAYTAKLDERAPKSKRNNILTFGKEDLMSSMNQFHHRWVKTFKNKKPTYTEMKNATEI